MGAVDDPEVAKPASKGGSSLLGKFDLKAMMPKGKSGAKAAAK
jgi:hypothetical protein